MKRLQTRRHLSNDGFSLMELIITVLISSIVTTAAVAFLSVGMRY
ncbi:MAG: prepilin-type N-terminal cleavage/methylation domain-containing protein, partial [Lachnospiraceae bacterium]|nr:prepilin-type N-terminal cleavage/methylation domain-containing protein [Lachnospiraceae bacterium]